MPEVERAGDAATCGHPNTGSDTVKADGRGITRVELDTAGGLIIGPGSQSVFANGLPVSLPGDIILPHTCCGTPGCSHHCAATTKVGLDTTVFAGTGFPTVWVSTGGEGGSDQEVSLAPDLTVQDISLVGCGETSPTDNTIICSESTVSANDFLGNTWTGELTINYTVANLGATDSGPFTMGLWETDPSLGVGPFLLSLLGASYINPLPVLVGSEEISNVPALSVYSGSFVVTSTAIDSAGQQYGYWPEGEWYYSVYADIGANIGEDPLGNIVEPEEEDNANPASVFTVE